MITNIETLDLYNSLVTKKALYRFTGSVKTVSFLLYPPIQTYDVFDVVREIHLCYGASFIADQSMNYNTIADVVILLSTYIFLVKKSGLRRQHVHVSVN